MKHEQLTIVCIAHLNWDHVWQRPQQIMSRLVAWCQIIYIDPPHVTDVDGPIHLQEQPGHPGIRVLRPIFPRRADLSLAVRFQELKRLLFTILSDAGPDNIVWVFAPHATSLVSAALPKTELVVYDCMDDYASFLEGRAADELRRSEALLMKFADLVFTGGPSMYEARKGRHPQLHCFPSGVDVAHYRQTTSPTTVEPAAIASLPHPRLGYFGVLDERLDWALIAAIAERRPDWHWLLVGPIDPAVPVPLPQNPNIHYLGQQSYQDLPAYLKGFDIATMPFALNQVTRFISPTKTLEYLAGGKQVISSSIADVVAGYSEIVQIADGADRWIATVEQELAVTSEQQQQRLDRAAPILEQSSWDQIAARMWTLMQAQLAEE